MVEPEDRRPWFVPVAGFLGAGKTTLLLAAAKILQSKGIRTAVVLNDQAGGLVDTALAEQRGLTADEVAGGCFCCRFSDLLSSLDRLERARPEVIFAEPVGSCTDLAATILRPLRYDFPHRFRIAPLTVVVDPAQWRRVQQANGDSNIRFLHEKQMEEADFLCFTKRDLSAQCNDEANLTAKQPEQLSFHVSGLTGEGVAAWLDEILSGRLLAGDRDLELDYQRYADAEASLAWLNYGVTLDLKRPLSPPELLGPFLDEVLARLQQNGVRIVHLKAIDSAATGYVKAAFIEGQAEPVVEGMLDSSPDLLHHLTLNLRASGDPAVIRPLIETAAGMFLERRRDERIACFRPAPPRPERRIAVMPPE